MAVTVDAPEPGRLPNQMSRSARRVRLRATPLVPVMLPVNLMSAVVPMAASVVSPSEMMLPPP